MIALMLAEQLRPSRWPILCMATNSRSIVIYPTTKESTFQFLVPSRWSRPSSGEKIWVNIPAPRQMPPLRKMHNEKCRRLTLTKTRRKTCSYSGISFPKNNQPQCTYHIIPYPTNSNLLSVCVNVRTCHTHAKGNIDILQIPISK